MIGVGVIGIGAIGSEVATRLAEGAVPGVELVGVAGRPGSGSRLRALAEAWHCAVADAPVALPALGADLVVEAAGVEAVREHAIPLLGAGADVMIMSGGALADPAFADCLRAAAAKAGRRVHLPSGSIAGLDGFLAAHEGGILDAAIVTRKHPDALRGAPYFKGNDLDLGASSDAVVVFDGGAREAIAGFPSNANVAVTLATAVGDIDRVSVQIIADPAATRTEHCITVIGASGTINVKMANLPFPSNPRTSAVAALSALASIRRLVSPLVLG